jgi:hypothetical protein
VAADGEAGCWSVVMEDMSFVSGSARGHEALAQATMANTGSTNDQPGRGL